jgi:hypothetical protein
MSFEKKEIVLFSSSMYLKINVETSDLNPRVMCTSKSNKKTGEPS